MDSDSQLTGNVKRFNEGGGKMLQMNISFCTVIEFIETVYSGDNIFFS